MKILVIRTDKPEAEIGLYDDDKRLAYDVWHAHRQLAETLHSRIQNVLDRQGLNLHDVTGVVCYKGPGSFTGLRIGISVANALAYSLNVPIVGETGEDWQEKGASRLAAGQTGTAVLPEYGADVHITAPKR
jgi:tRNA threonylcarbamoyladenosine biosynthesis protein TsaB